MLLTRLQAACVCIPPLGLKAAKIRLSPCLIATVIDVDVNNQKNRASLAFARKHWMQALREEILKNPSTWAL